MEATDNTDVEMKHEEVAGEVKEGEVIAEEVKEGEVLVDEVKPEGEHIEEPVPVGKPISGLIDQGMAAMIQDMGFTKAVAEKSLLYTNNKSVEGAMDWIQQHQEDDDFLDEEFIADESQHDPNKPKLSKEEKAAAAIDLQKRLRAKRVAEDKRIEEEHEKERIRATKDIQIAKRKMEEQRLQLDVDLDKKEKKKFLKEKKEMEELLRKVTTKIWLILILMFRNNVKEQARSMFQVRNSRPRESHHSKQLKIH
jgi:hypothetical protein